MKNLFIFLILPIVTLANFEGQYQIANQHCFVNGTEITTEKLEYLKVIQSNGQHAFHFKLENRIPKSYVLSRFESPDLSINYKETSQWLAYKSEASYQEKNKGNFVEEVHLSLGSERSQFSFSSVWIVNGRYQKDFVCWADVNNKS